MREHFPHLHAESDVTLIPHPLGLQTDIRMNGVGYASLFQPARQPGLATLYGPFLDDGPNNELMDGRGGDARLFEQILDVARDTGAQSITRRVKHASEAQLFRLVPPHRLSYAVLAKVTIGARTGNRVEAFLPVQTHLKVVIDLVGQPLEVVSRGTKKSVHVPMDYLITARLYDNMADPYDEV